MGYSCPVCGHPQADGVHLANHLAFTAITRGGAHEEWLDDHVDGWEQLGEETLAEAVTPGATETEFPQVFEDTTESARRENSPHDHGSDESPDGQQSRNDPTHHDRFDPAGADLPEGGNLTDETAEILERARELTRQRRTDAAQESRDDNRAESTSSDGTDHGDGDDRPDHGDGDGRPDHGAATESESE